MEKLETIKDLEVTFDSRLHFDKHIKDKINKALSMLGIIKRNFTHITPETFVTLYKSMIRPHIEYAHSVWFLWKQEYIKNLEHVQRKATKQIKQLKHLSYEERLKLLKLPTLVYR